MHRPALRWRPVALRVPGAPRCRARLSTSTDTPNPVVNIHQGWLFADSVFPIRVARWDIRHYIGLLRQESLLTDLQIRLQSVNAHNFTVRSLLPYHKDGGVFVRFTYSASDNQAALDSISEQLTHNAHTHGPLPSWLGLRRGQFWLVKGTPWIEDMNRFPSQILNVAFDGPDIHEQSLYHLFRSYGHIQNLSHTPLPAPPGGLRSSLITFDRIRSATIARNVLNDFCASSPNSPALTRLRTAYQRPVQPHVFRDWISGHPKISLPIIIFLIGSLTYTVFDPIRSLMVQAKLLDYFNFRESKFLTWLRINTIDRLSNAWGSSPELTSFTDHLWRERDEAAGAIKSYLADFPSTIAFVHGPQGSGKYEIVQPLVSDSGRTTLVIDCRELVKAPSDTHLVASLAAQTGYWPIFTFLNSVNNLIDLASVGLIGQKAGLSSSVSDQLQQILTVVATALRGVSEHHRAAVKRKLKKHEKELLAQESDARKRDKIILGTWHDGRLDCVAGNGVISELGIGDECLADVEGFPLLHVEHHPEEEGREYVRKQKTREEMEALGTLPVVVIRNFESKAGSGRDEVLKILAKWAVMLVENQIAHVIVLSDNRENSRLLAREMRSKPLFAVSLSDADPRSSVSYVQQKLRDADISVEFAPQQIAYIERLGGRASELDSLVHRVRNGQRLEDAVEDIINRGVEELRKNAFGDDVEEAKNLPWTREQAWTVIKALAKQEEVPYHKVLVDFPFKGDETALRSMEHAELIVVSTQEGRPSTVRPGRPVLRWVFERLVNDHVFQATQDLVFNEKVVGNNEKTVRACEEELSTLKSIMALEAQPWWMFGLGRKSATAARAKYLGEKMLVAERDIEALEKKNKELKKVLAKGD